ncbi:hypothetical protein ACQ4LE_005081 [Meloidogyne hapla]
MDSEMQKKNKELNNLIDDQYKLEEKIVELKMVVLEENSEKYFEELCNELGINMEDDEEDENDEEEEEDQSQSFQFSFGEEGEPSNVNYCNFDNIDNCPNN